MRIQEASRKRRPSSIYAEAWAECVARALEYVVFKMIMQEKWLKAKAYIMEVRAKIGHRNKPTFIEHKLLERVWSFLNYLGCVIQLHLCVGV